MITFVTYSNNLSVYAEIEAVLSGPEECFVLYESAALIPIGTGIVNQGTHCVEVASKAIVLRPSYTPVVTGMTVKANGVDILSISGVPQGAECFVYGPVETRAHVEDGVIEFSTVLPGRYSVHIKAFPYLDRVIEIDAY